MECKRELQEPREEVYFNIKNKTYFVLVVITINEITNFEKRCYGDGNNRK